MDNMSHVIRWQILLFLQYHMKPKISDLYFCKNAEVLLRFLWENVKNWAFLVFNLSVSVDNVLLKITPIIFLVVRTTALDQSCIRLPRYGYNVRSNS